MFMGGINEIVSLSQDVAPEIFRMTTEIGRPKKTGISCWAFVGKAN